jgi:hypothetical protein
MSPDQARELLADVFAALWKPGTKAALLYDVADVREGSALSLWHYCQSAQALERLELEGEVPPGSAEAFQIVNKDNRQAYKYEKVGLHEEIARDGVEAVGTAREQEGWSVAGFDAFMDVSEEYVRRTTGFVRPRARGAGAPARRARGSRASPDDDLADLPKRCPRCGGALRPLLPSPHWRCDPCADALWRAMLDHEVERVLAEAEQITRKASA